MSPWVTAFGEDLPRPEYPRPHLVRPRWLNLNGTWEFAFDDDDRGRRAGWESGRELPLRILVPFTFESALSGIGERTAHPVVWYRRELAIPGDLLEERLLLHIGACDFATTVWINGRFAGSHRGGYAPICCEIRDLARAGSNEIVLRVEDWPAWTQPRGKQIVGEAPFGIDYDRVTGIWQTVWLEPVPELHIESCWSHFHLDDGRLLLEAQTSHGFAGEIEAVVSFQEVEVARGRAYMQERCEGRVPLTITQPRLWSPEDPALYDVTLSLLDNERRLDVVQTYAGLREVTRRGRSLYLNGAPLQFRGVLDQGYFPGGWYTAATDDDLRRDIELTKKLGFNGARKHQKAEDPRWLYWADRLGLLVWAEMPSGRDFSRPLVEDLTREWLEIVGRDRMHPSIVAWVPLNESWGVDTVDRSPRQQAWVRALHHLTRSADATRLVVANDGWHFLTGDIWGLHIYVSDPAELVRHLERVIGEPTTELAPGRQAALPGVEVADLPVMLSELGGLAFRDPRSPDETAGAWGYDVAATPEQLEGALRALMAAVRRRADLLGFVWTQLTDVQQEINGLLYFDRTPKVPLAQLRSIFGDQSVEE